MDEKAREQIAMFRYSVIGSLISGELCHGDLTKQIAELSKDDTQYRSVIALVLVSGQLRTGYMLTGTMALKV